MKKLSIAYNVICIVSIFSYHLHNTASETSSILKKQSTSKDSSEINPYLQKILQELSNLPTNYQPEHPEQALKFMMKGNQIFKSVYTDKFFQACSLSNLNAADTRVLQNALSSSDEQFWKLIHADEQLQHEIEKCNVSYTRENFLSINYTMLFRINYARLHISSQQVWHQFKSAYEQALIALQWYLFAQAIIQDSIFTSGMITIPDPDYSLFKFMDGYCELVSPCYRFYSGLHPHSLWQTHAYTRKSSHWTRQKQFNDSNFGIDIKDNEYKILPILPGNKSHILFGILKSGLLFIKWEEFGTTINFKEKDFSAIKHTLRYFQKKEKEDEALQRREKISQDVMLQFRSLYPHKLTKHQADEIQIFGIQKMLEILDKDAADFFTKYLIQRKKYIKDTLHMRKGGEIILQPRKFVSLT